MVGSTPEGAGATAGGGLAATGAGAAAAEPDPPSVGALGAETRLGALAGETVAAGACAPVAASPPAGAGDGATKDAGARVGATLRGDLSRGVEKRGNGDEAGDEAPPRRQQEGSGQRALIPKFATKGGAHVQREPGDEHRRDRWGETHGQEAKYNEP